MGHAGSARPDHDRILLRSWRSRVRWTDRRTGLSDDDVQSAIRELERTGFIPKVQRKGAGRADILGGITGAAYQVPGLHQSRDEAQEQFIELLAKAIAREPDPERKSRLQALLRASADVGGQALANLLGAVFARLALE